MATLASGAGRYNPNALELQDKEWTDQFSNLNRMLDQYLVSAQPSSSNASGQNYLQPSSQFPIKNEPNPQNQGFCPGMGDKIIVNDHNKPPLMPYGLLLVWDVLIHKDSSANSHWAECSRHKYAYLAPFANYISDFHSWRQDHVLNRHRPGMMSSGKTVYCSWNPSIPK